MGKASRRKLYARVKASEAMTKNQLKAWGIDAPILIRNNLPQKQKISNAISEILDTEIDKNAPLEDYRACVNTIVMAWNMTLVPPEMQEKQLKALEAFVRLQSQADVADDIASALSLVKRLMQKKEVMFPDDKRFIVSHDCQFIGGKVHITAAALTENDQPVPAS
jgi:hypothetical protein